MALLWCFLWVKDVQSSFDLVQAATTFAHVVLKPKKDACPGGSLVYVSRDCSHMVKPTLCFCLTTVQF